MNYTDNYSTPASATDSLRQGVQKRVLGFDMGQSNSPVSTQAPQDEYEQAPENRLTRRQLNSDFN